MEENSKSLLVVIDVQNCFINEHSKDVPAKIHGHLSAHKQQYDFVIFTKFVNKPNSPFINCLKWDGAMAPEETKIDPKLEDFLTEDNVFEKETYSIFKAPKINEFIKDNKISKIFLCGLTS